MDNYDNWIILWKIVLIAGLSAFSVMAVWVSIGGFFDVKKLIKGMQEASKAAEEAEEKP